MFINNKQKNVFHFINRYYQLCNLFLRVS
ncbi:hypothetical protein CCP4SC76_510004 [Gammaproteobacteria bacterium]